MFLERDDALRGLQEIEGLAGWHNEDRGRQDRGKPVADRVGDRDKAVRDNVRTLQQVRLTQEVDREAREVNWYTGSRFQ